ncbi:MAG: sigma-54 dependent transcriptional regulator [Planctomycetaceae bacterium]
MLQMSEANSTDDYQPLQGIIGQSPTMQEVARLTRLVARTSVTVLLTGETGTGKELIARALHTLSPRATGPFIRVNCGALSETLLESELFGHVKGAFTNALENRTGRFEAAHGGTIFLDEIDSLSFTLQVKLLRVLQEHEFERVGDTRTIQVDCRIVAATNRDLLADVSEQRFREDLYYRLNVMPIELPPLRERKADIPLLVTFFLGQYAQENGWSIPGPSAEFMTWLENYSWPGNVRELQNYIERAVVLSQGGELSVEFLPAHVRGLAPVRSFRRQRSLGDLCTELVALGLQARGETSDNLHPQIMNLVEKELITQVLTLANGTQTKTAQMLGINRNTLHKKIEDYGLQGRDEG